MAYCVGHANAKSLCIFGAGDSTLGKAQSLFYNWRAQLLLFIIISLWVASTCICMARLVHTCNVDFFLTGVSVD